MAFKLISRPEPVLETFYVTDNEAIAYGQCLKFNAGRLTASGDATDIAAISTQAVTAGTDQTCKVIIPTAEHIFEAPYSGTPDATFLPGMVSADLDTAGTGVDAADVTGGKIGILSINTATGTVRCKIVGRAFG
jgi:hypothetical protein